MWLASIAPRPTIEEQTLVVRDFSGPQQPFEGSLEDCLG